MHASRSFTSLPAEPRHSAVRASGDVREIVVVGAGIIGLATAMHILERHPGLNVLVVEKEQAIGQHQTGHNSGVIHRGIYYTPGSLKARLCVKGADQLVAFCAAHDLPYRLCGKLIVAADESEIPGLRALQKRGEANGVPDLRWLEAQEIRSIEPHAAGVAALHSPETGIVDFSRVARAYADEVLARGGQINLGAEVTSIREMADHVRITVGARTIRAALVVTCAGLQSDRLAAMTQPARHHQLRIVPFRGDYYVLHPSRSDLARGLIYPVPDPTFPFLGVHFTPRMDGSVWAGPNAVPAFARQGYRLRDVSLRDLAETLTFRGFWRMGFRYWRTGLGEMWRDVSRPAFADALRRYVPELRNDDLVSRASGVRAQALAVTGDLVDDFVLTGSGRSIHVTNAPSPAATSSLAIADLIAADATKRLVELGA